jgi:hypothetical protein
MCGEYVAHVSWWGGYSLRVWCRIFGPKRDEVTGEWRRLHNEELYDLYTSSNIMRVIKSRGMSCWARNLKRVGGEEGCIQGFSGETSRKTRLRCEDHIQMNLGKVGWGEWAGLIWLKIRKRRRALMNAVMNLRVA